MRSVERTPWAERRSVTHDAMCLWAARNAQALIRFLSTDGPRLDRVSLEEPCGPGFCDVFIESDAHTRAWFVEVKTDEERASGGDIIRQLRWYAAQRRGYERKELVCLCESRDENLSAMLRIAGVIVVPFDTARALVSGQRTTENGASSGPASSSASNTEAGQ